MKHIFLFIATMILIGCGGGGGSGSSSNSRYEGPMDLEKQYTMFPGDSVQKDSPSAKILVTHIGENAESNIELVEGSATIIRQP